MAVDAVGQEVADKFLEHYGVKGMKWGQRRTRAERKAARESSDVSVTDKPGKKKIVTEGGAKRTASEDAIVAAVGRQVAKSSGTKALSNAELKAVVERMNLEAQYSKLEAQRAPAGKRFAKEFLSNLGKQRLNRVANSQIDDLLRREEND